MARHACFTDYACASFCTTPDATSCSFLSFLQSLFLGSDAVLFDEKHSDTKPVDSEEVSNKEFYCVARGLLAEVPKANCYAMYYGRTCIYMY